MYKDRGWYLPCSTCYELWLPRMSASVTSVLVHQLGWHCNYQRTPISIGTFQWDFASAKFLPFSWNLPTSGIACQMECSKITDWKYETTWTTNNGLVILGNAWLAPHGPLLLSLAQRSSVSSPLVSSSNQLTFSPSLLFLTQPIQSIFFTMRLVFCIVLLCSVALVSSSPQVQFFSSKSRHQCYMKDIKLM